MKHFTDDLGADWLNRLELMIVIEDRFADVVLAALQEKVHPGIMAKRDFFCGYFFKARFFWGFWSIRTDSGIAAAPRAALPSALPMASPSSYRLDNRHCAGGGKNSDEKQVTESECKTTTKASEQGTCDQLQQT
jgi:hypothetical protein